MDSEAPSTPPQGARHQLIVTIDESKILPNDTKEYRLPNVFILHAYVSVAKDYDHEDSNEVNDAYWKKIREDISQICAGFATEMTIKINAVRESDAEESDAKESDDDDDDYHQGGNFGDGGGYEPKKASVSSKPRVKQYVHAYA